MSRWHHTLAGTYDLQWSLVDCPGKQTVLERDYYVLAMVGDFRKTSGFFLEFA
jgi:hypothetical protein